MTRYEYQTARINQMERLAVMLQNVCDMSAYITAMIEVRDSSTIAQAEQEVL